MPGFEVIRNNFPEPVRYGPPVFTSTEPTVDGYNTLPEETVPRNCLQIVAGDSRQLAVFKMIEHMPSQLLQPFGQLFYDRRARGYPWVRRSDEGQRPKIMYLRNGPSVVFQVTFHTEETVKVHVPFESWDRSTGTAEDMRASLQQAYLNLCRGVVHHTVILKRGERPLPICESAIIPGRARVVATTATSYGHQRSRSHNYAYGGQSSSLAVLPMPKEATMTSRHHPLAIKDTFVLYDRRRRDEEYHYEDISDAPYGSHLDRDTYTSIRRWQSNAGHERRGDVYRDRVVPQGNGRHHFRHVSHEDVTSSYGSGSDPSSASGSSAYYYRTIESPYYGSGSEQSTRAKRKTGFWSRLF